MDDSQRNRSNPQNNPFNSGDFTVTEQYDEYGNRIVNPNPPEPSVSQVEEEDLGIGNTENIESTPVEDPVFGPTIERAEENLGDVRDDIGVDSPIENKPSIFDTPLEEPKPVISTPSANMPKIKKSGKKVVTTLVIAALVTLGLSGSILLVDKYQESQKKVLGVTSSANDILDMTARVKSIVELPYDEAPTQAAKVTDRDKLSSNPFFDHSKNGDMVLIYEKSQEAILYRPSTGKVIAIGPTNGISKEAVSTPVASASPTLSQEPSPAPSINP